jgi:hypothetical protein
MAAQDYEEIVVIEVHRHHETGLFHGCKLR